MSLDFEVGMQLMGLWLLFTWCFVVGLWLEEAGYFGVGMQLGLEGLAGIFWQELLLEGPEIGFSWCTDGLGMVGLSMFNGQMCSLLQQYDLPCASIV